MARPSDRPAGSFPPPAAPASHERISFGHAGRIVHDRYELVEPIGTGGMGSVWLARDRVLDCHVAIKIHRGPPARAVVGAFQQEALRATRVRDPAVPRTLDFGLLPEGVPFIAMELVSGRSLGDLMELGPVAPERAVQLMLPIAAALGRAHRSGFVHCDVKPGNILLAEEDGALHPKLIDFGIACAVGCERTEVIGTPAYMSPEHALGRPCDARSDVWSFCVVLAELLLGRALFRGEGDAEVLERVLAADFCHLPHGVDDAELRAIVERGLARDPGWRWASFDELGDALAGWLHERGEIADARGCVLASRWGSVPRSEAPGPSRPIHAWRWIGVLFAAGLVFIALLALVWP